MRKVKTPGWQPSRVFTSFNICKQVHEAREALAMTNEDCSEPPLIVAFDGTWKNVRSNRDFCTPFYRRAYVMVSSRAFNATGKEL